jgi:hypothetical protein
MTRNGTDAARAFRVADLFDASHDFLWDSHCLILGYVGSQSHGTYVPPTDPDAIDDVDLMGVLLPPRRYLLGLEKFEHWVCQKDELDVVAYSLHKFVGLLLKGNPNVLGLLWLRDEDYLRRSSSFLALQENRSLFAAKSVYASFAGYASGQLQRMTSYSQEIEDEIQRLGRELEAAGWLVSEVMDGRSLPMPKGLTSEEANTKAQRLKSLRAKFHTAYMGEKRKGLVRKHGYDTKNASHLIRLLLMCGEFLRTGQMQVYREHDAELLRAIKRGEWTLEAVKVRAEELFAKAKAARDASPLPDEPDRKAVNELLVDICLREYA